MSFFTDKKSEHEKLAVQAAKTGEYGDALFHAIKVTQYGIDLAEHSEGLIAQAYLDDADSWLSLSRQLKQKTEQNGGSSRSAEQLKSASEQEDRDKQEAVASDWLLTEKPEIRLADVAGLDEVKKVIREDLILAVQYPEVYKDLKIELGGGALMYGPPGNGKTYIAKAIAGELDAAFFSVSGAQLKNKYVGETEKNMRRLFEEAAKYERSVIFLDEIHAILARRGREKVSAVDEFLVMTDGIQKRKNLLLILGATNYPWMLDSAVFRRLGKIIYVGMPDTAAREAIFRLQFQGVPCDQDFSYADFAGHSDRFSGADIVRICTSAKKSALMRMIASSQNRPQVTREDVTDAIQTMKPTVSPEMISQYRDWEKSFFDGGTFSDDSDEE